MQQIKVLIDSTPNFILAIIFLSAYINVDIILIKYKQLNTSSTFQRILLNYIVIPLSKSLPLLILTVFYINLVEPIIKLKKSYFIILCFFITLTFALIVIRLILIRILHMDYKKGYRSIVIWINILMFIFTLALAYIKTNSSILEKKDGHLLKDYLDITWVTFLSAMLTLNTITKTSIDQLRETSMYPHLIKIKSKIKHIPQEMNYEEKVILSIYIISIFCYIVLFLYKLL
ncbi:hypothetical protein K4S65_01000 [Staphylococcus epidermidis]|nr:hypothetical protein [Staphylococcus epidermidis]